MEEYYKCIEMFFQQKPHEQMQLGFILHDFNSDSKIDINDAYDLMYIGNLIKTPVFQLIQNDLFGIN